MNKRRKDKKDKAKFEPKAEAQKVAVVVKPKGGPDEVEVTQSLRERVAEKLVGRQLQNMQNARAADSGIEPRKKPVVESKVELPIPRRRLPKSKGLRLTPKTPKLQ